MVPRQKRVKDAEHEMSKVYDNLTFSIDIKLANEVDFNKASTAYSVYNFAARGHHQDELAKIVNPSFIK